MHGMLNEEVYITPVRWEGDIRPRHEGWSQDWYELSEIPEWVKLVSGWNELPQLMYGEIPLPIKVTFKYSRNMLTAGRISWDSLPPGTYHKICIRTSSGELLWEQSIGPTTLETGSSVLIVCT